MNAKATKQIGEELGRLTEADRLLTSAVKQSNGAFECKVSIFQAHYFIPPNYRIYCSIVSHRQS